MKMAMPSLDIPPAFTISHNVPACLSFSPDRFLAERPHLEHLMAGALVFRINKKTSQLETLLIRRAASDSYPLKWERPAGSTSTLDSSLLSSAVRELWEETGLHASHIRCAVGLSTLSGKDLKGWGVEPEVEQAELLPEDDALTVAILETGKTWGIVTVIVDVEENLSEDGIDGKAVVKVSPQEHEEWTWVTEEQVLTGKDKDGRRMEYTSEGVWKTVLEGFRLKKGMDAVPS